MFRQYLATACSCWSDMCACCLGTEIVDQDDMVLTLQQPIAAPLHSKGRPECHEQARQGSHNFMVNSQYTD